ncbi:MAG: PD40 domain-containing protein, partial [Bacteriovoracaceae bacterium]|nr:PD40 domain-containing protein [Bacteriovoracaceae bacterium]
MVVGARGIGPIVLGLSCLLLLGQVWAEEDAVLAVAIGNPQTAQEVMLFQEVMVQEAVAAAAADDTALTPKAAPSVDPLAAKFFAQRLRALWMNDFNFYRKIFQVYAAEEDPEKKAGPHYNVTATVKAEAGKYRLTAIARQAPGSQVVATVEKEFPAAAFKSYLAVDLAHQVADGLYQGITGKKSIFTSKIFFVSDHDSTPERQIKEVYQANFDGGGVQRLTFHQGVVIGPDVSYDGKKVVYSLIEGDATKERNINLFLLNLDTRQSTLLSNRPGINSGAVFLPGDKEVALTLSYAGNPEIYRLDIKTKKLTPITNSAAIDVDPSMAARPDLMAFLSGRGGKANVYTLDPRGVEKNVRRISYVGKFNATPRLSPDGQEIAFVSWADETFDIFRLNSDGRGLVRLTKDFGSCEEPSYSPDGQFIAFQAKRLVPGAQNPYNLYIM